MQGAHQCQRKTSRNGGRHPEAAEGRLLQGTHGGLASNVARAILRGGNVEE
jgi:hypothetical protein